MENNDERKPPETFEDGHAPTKAHTILVKQEDGSVLATIWVDPSGNCKVEGKTPAIEKELQEKVEAITAQPLTFTTSFAEKYGGQAPYEEVAQKFDRNNPFYAFVLVNVLNEHLWERAARLTGQQRWAVLVS